MGEAKRRGNCQERLEQSIRRQITKQQIVNSDPDREVKLRTKRPSKALLTALMIGAALGHHD